MIRPCSCGKPVMRYMTGEGLKAAPYCRECARSDTRLTLSA
ncbi:MAG: hypothetical protein OEY23_00510 [Acidimicrobiia bacterium]|nr:hypothetical protein [Acidimicrobiia bacterium]